MKYMNTIIILIFVLSGCYQEPLRNAPPVAEPTQNTEISDSATCDEYMECAKECKILNLGDKTDSIRKQCIVSECSFPRSEYLTTDDFLTWGYACAEVSNINPKVCVEGYGSCMLIEIDLEEASTGYSETE